jgi:hypothetical protein
MPLDADFVKNGDPAAFTRSADGLSLVVRDAGNYVISACGNFGTANPQIMIAKGVHGDIAVTTANILNQSYLAGVTSGYCPVSWSGYLPAGQVISVTSWMAAVTQRQMIQFSITRTGAGPQGPPGPAGGMLNTQRLIGSGSGYRAVPGTGGQVYADTAGVVPMRLSYTPPVNCWWEVHGNMGTIQKLDAAYHYGYMDLILTPADADGYDRTEQIEEQHSTVQIYAFRSALMLFKLTAGVAYRCDMLFSTQGGSWQYSQNTANLSMIGKAWPR